MNEPPIEATAKEMFRLYYGLITPVAVDEFWRVHNDKESWLRLARWHHQKVLEAKQTGLLEAAASLRDVWHDSGDTKDMVDYLELKAADLAKAIRALKPKE